MRRELVSADFSMFFQEVHGHSPFPWQERLVENLARDGVWCDVLDLPTGFGKTAALDTAVFHLALEARRGAERRAPVRIALVVDRRLVVDDAFVRAKKIEKALADPKGEIAAEVARRLKLLAGEDAPPLLARRLRGGIPREDDWARTPSQPTILCSTVDQVGSRLLFRGYGVSNSMKPVHAGLLGSDCLILLDEAHLSEPFRQTLGWVQRYRGNAWREKQDATAPWGVTLLTATPEKKSAVPFQLEKEDYDNAILQKRWSAKKPARLVELEKVKGATTEQEVESNKAADKQRVDKLVDQTREGLASLRESGVEAPAIAVVVNRVARARAVFDELHKEFKQEENDLILLVGPSRSVERDKLAERLGPIRTGNARDLERPLLIVSTQCIEVGVDIDLDGLITEAAPLDALRQRFGRLNRAGREITPYAAIIGSNSKVDAKDPVYGEAIVKTWAYLKENPDIPASKTQLAEVDFGLEAFKERPVDKLGDLLSPKQDAPVLMPAHLDLLSQTSPIPYADPEVSLYLHGPSRAADSVSVVWRADVDPEFQETTYRLMELVPPRAAEAIELPVWAVRSWLAKQNSEHGQLADIPSPATETKEERVRRKVFRWTGDEDSSQWTSSVRPGDSIVVPASYGGADEYGWNPNSEEAVKDVAAKAAGPFAGRRFAVRVGPGLLQDEDKEEQLAKTLASTSTRRWKEFRDAVREIDLPENIREELEKLDRCKKGKVECFTDAYGDKDNCPRGVVFLAPLGIEMPPGEKSEQQLSLNATEDDVAGSLPGFAMTLQRHCEDVEKKAVDFAERAGLSADRVTDLKLAGHLHDAGKADPRFQAWLAYGDPLGADLDKPDDVLAKSARPLPAQARERSGLPDRWRHEALSVRLAPHMPRFDEARDKQLVLWLVGTHHGQGRPFFPHVDLEDNRDRSGFPRGLDLPEALKAGYGPQSLAYDWAGLDWSGLYEVLKRRYGVWELARMEAVLRLADHRASEEESTQ